MQAPPILPFMPMMLFKGRKPKAPPPTEPQATLYVRNLNERVKPKAMEMALRTIFSKFGTIIDVKVKRHIKHRGQAFVSFENKDIATKALQKAQKFPLFEKQMDVQYAREPAFAVSKLQGNAAFVSHKRKRDENKPSAKRPKMQKTEEGTPNSILFVQNIPKDISADLLNNIFAAFPGFKEVRLIPSKKDIAFVDFDTELEAIAARQATHGYRISDDNEIKVTYAKK